MIQIIKLKDEANKGAFKKICSPKLHFKTHHLEHQVFFRGKQCNELVLLPEQVTRWSTARAADQTTMDRNVRKDKSKGEPGKLDDLSSLLVPIRKENTACH